MSWGNGGLGDLTIFGAAGGMGGSAPSLQVRTQSQGEVWQVPAEPDERGSDGDDSTRLCRVRRHMSVCVNMCYHARGGRGFLIPDF